MKTKVYEFTKKGIYQIALALATVLLFIWFADVSGYSDWLSILEAHGWHLVLSFLANLALLLVALTLIQLAVIGIKLVLAYQKLKYLERIGFPNFRYRTEAIVFYVFQIILLPVTLIEMGVVKIWNLLK